MKTCPKCLFSLENSSFYKNLRTPDGLSYVCKLCQSKYSKEYRLKNKVNIANNKKQWYKSNNDRVKRYTKLWYAANKDRIIKRVVDYRAARLKTDIQFRLQKNLRHRLNKFLRQESSRVALTFLGCSVEQLKIHLESRFLPGMNWGNYGKYGWHIDHIKPLSSFDLTKIDQVAAACHYTNLQPLWAQDNISKSNKVE